MELIFFFKSVFRLPEYNCSVALLAEYLLLSDWQNAETFCYWYGAFARHYYIILGLCINFTMTETSVSGLLINKTKYTISYKNKSILRHTYAISECLKACSSRQSKYFEKCLAKTCNPISNSEYVGHSESMKMRENS